MSDPSGRERFCGHLAAVFLAAAISALPAGAATPLAALWMTPETTAVLGGVTVTDEQILLDDLSGGVGMVPLGVLPGDSAIVAYHQTADGEHLIVFETTVVLGAVTASPADIVRIDGALSASLEFDGSAVGIPPGVGIDALTMDDSDYLLSFDVTVTLGGTTFDDEDLARWDGAGFSLAFDGSQEGVDPALDLDAAHLLENDHLLLSFDGSAAIGGFASDDEDVLEFSAGPLWELAFDGSAAHAGLADTDVEALFADVYVLTVDRVGSGSGSITSPDGIDCGLDCTEILGPGSLVTLTATADPGSVFTGWIGAACETSRPCQLTMDGDRSVIGRFLLDADVLIFMDGFESGDTSQWDNVVGE